MNLEKYSIGIGDRFAHEGIAQLRAIVKANGYGLNISPVWNKSNREHRTVGSKPAEVRKEADTAVAALGFTGKYFVDADHINLNTVSPYVETADFFTLDVADSIGEPSTAEEVQDFVDTCGKYSGELSIPGIEQPFAVKEEQLSEIGAKFLAPARQAAEIYKFIEASKGKGNFITEVSMDEVETPQTPIELFFILKLLAHFGVPIQTIAPKFTGRFNKGVDYQGDIGQFTKEFENDILVLDFAIKEFGLPEDLKLSIHSGSDKFSIYPIMGQIVKKYDKGLHVKTAGTTWLEEVIGLAMAGGQGLDLAKTVYFSSLRRQKELCAPYSDVIDIDSSKLPTVEEVKGWDGEKFVNTLRHIPDHQDYNSNFRQLIHVGYKMAAGLGDTFTDLLEQHSEIIGACVEENIFERHLKRLFSIK